jgi:hypothetical protein
LDGKRNGKFLDIGASDPKIINNTLLLEKNFGWTGVQIEIDEQDPWSGVLAATMFAT